MNDNPVFGPGTATILRLKEPYDDGQGGGRKNYVIETDGNDDVPTKILMSPKGQYAEDNWSRLHEMGTYEFQWVILGEYKNAYLQNFKQVGTVNVQPTATTASTATPQRSQKRDSVDWDRKDAYATAGMLFKVSGELIAAKVFEDVSVEGLARKLYFEFEGLVDEILEDRRVAPAKIKAGSPAVEPAVPAEAQNTNLDVEAEAVPVADEDDIPF